ncbi:unnamed protein product [Kuraishia capsulata CBS 1993]|uniref:Glycoside hydrolase family 125 protein n=1 Tax=Kuraishia capsulata CBS 1993 TaxID=1382522 RepID=W6MPP1_9ASCO|nr:uncharacterized protein KUCA_T00003094001 [Kuraishia capsulata CBS 1993]CDK27117.1 unnamed protein product [Kuraishia capsulata CBS 1993]
MAIIFGKRYRDSRVVLTVFAVLLLIFVYRSHSADDAVEFQSLQPPAPKKKTGTKEIQPHLQQEGWLSSKMSRCANYLDYSQQMHKPLSSGSLKLPYMRPPESCRTFSSAAVEKVILDLKERVRDPDLSRLIENCLPNTLDTTILWHDSSKTDPRTFVVTGDIHAEWLRDAARQLSVYQPMARYDPALQLMIKGAIAQQANYILKAPYCNAFQPPLKSNVKRKPSTVDYVSPPPPWRHVFECKWEIDSLASFLTLSNDYYDNTDDTSFMTKEWFSAMEMVLVILQRESSPTFDSRGNILPFYYSFQRDTRIGTETLPLAGTGNPVNFDTGLVRSAFRPSDDACTFQLFVPGNAQMYVELNRVIPLLSNAGQAKLAKVASGFAKNIRNGIYQHAIVNHPVYGKVFAYEVDGYGSASFMDDANIPSLLSLPDLGFVEKTDSIYRATRKMIMAKKGNPYYLEGAFFKGIGGPHIGINNAWPMSLLIAIRTTDNDDEIAGYLTTLMKTTGRLGLMHESIDVNSRGGMSYTRPWFAWANSEFGKTILDLAKRKPHLIFNSEYAQTPYDVDEAMKAAGLVKAAPAAKAT